MLIQVLDVEVQILNFKIQIFSIQILDFKAGEMIPIEYQLCTKWRCEQAKNTVGIAHELASESLEVIHIVNYVKQVV